MAIYTKESLERLKSGIDLVEVLSSHVQFQRAGSSHKACCPFHEEKTPSFVVQRGDTHYHCFGCGAHGDAIAFLMQQLQMSFTEAIEYLSDRFQIPLERVEKIDDKMVNRTLLRNCLEKGAELYHFFLLHSKEGEEALDYLYKRGIDLEFIQQFQIGYALRSPKIFRSAMHALGFDDPLLQEVGLISSMEGGKRKISSSTGLPFRFAMLPVLSSGSLHGNIEKTPSVENILILPKPYCLKSPTSFSVFPIPEEGLLRRKKQFLSKDRSTRSV